MHYSAHHIHIPYAIKNGKQEKEDEARDERWNEGEKNSMVKKSRRITTIVELFNASFGPSTVKMPTDGS